MVKQTAGRDALGQFAPKFAQLNDDVLFGEVWSREDMLSLRDRSMVTVVALMAQGLVDSSFRYHLETARRNGVSKTEIAEVLTHAAFYAGWPKAWAAFAMAKEVWADEVEPADGGKEAFERASLFPVGEPNDAFATCFDGQSYLAPVSTCLLYTSWPARPTPSADGQGEIHDLVAGLFRQFGVGVRGQRAFLAALQAC